MNKILIFLLAGAALGCSPIPDLVGVTAVIIDGGDDSDGDTTTRPRNPRKPTDGMDFFDTDMMRRRGDLGERGDLGDHGDLGADGDLGIPPDLGPCPTVTGASAAFCYWGMGTGDLNLATALVYSGTDMNCDLTAGRLSVNAAMTTCAVQFSPAVLADWSTIDFTKPVHLAFSYSIQGGVDHAILTVNIPAGSANEMIKVNGIFGSQNVINLYSPPAGMMAPGFAPGFSMALAGTAKKARVSFDWVSVWQ